MVEKINKGKEIIMNRMDIPKDFIYDLPKISILGKEEITIENHKGIISFEKNLVKISTINGNITIKGSDFEILYIATTTIVINGKCTSVELEQV